VNSYESPEAMVEGIEDDVPEEQYEAAAEEDVVKEAAEDKQLCLFMEGIESYSHKALLKKLTPPYISGLQRH